MLVSFPVQRDMNVLFPEPVLPRTKKNLSVARGFVAPIKAESRRAWSSSRSFTLSISGFILVF